MKTYKEFLEEKVDTRALRNREFAQKKNQMKPGAPDKGGAMVHVPGKGRTEKEATGKFDPRGARATSKRPPGVSGTSRPTSARAALAKYDKAAARARDAKETKAAEEKFKKSRTGFAAGVKQALGGDIIGSLPKKGDKKYNEIARKDRDEKRKEFAKKKVQQAGSYARKVLTNMNANNSVTVDKGTPIA